MPGICMRPVRAKIGASLPASTQESSANVLAELGLMAVSTGIVCLRLRRQRYPKTASGGAALQLQVAVRSALVGDGEIVERRQRDLQVGALGQLERVEAAARHIEQLIALDLADRAQLAGELVALAQQLRLAVAAAFGDAAELDRDQADRAGNRAPAPRPDRPDRGARRGARPTATSARALPASARTAGSARARAPADPRPHSATRRRRFHAA